MTEHRASFRIVCDINGDFRVEVLDKTINHWYIAVSKLGKGEEGYKKANEYCKEHFQNVISTQTK